MAVGLKKGERKKRQSYEEIVGASDFSDSDLLNYEEAAVISSDDDFVCIFFYEERDIPPPLTFSVSCENMILTRKKEKNQETI